MASQQAAYAIHASAAAVIALASGISAALSEAAFAGSK